MMNAITRYKQSGMTLIELMVATVIGIFLLLGLSVVFVNSSRTQRELEYSGQVIENGRYASELLFQDIRHAGFYGFLVSVDEATSEPDPCDVSTEAKIDTAMKLPLQGYDTASKTVRATLGGHCSAWLTNDNLKVGSDVLVVRRANTNTATGLPDADTFYVQANAAEIDVQLSQSSPSGINMPAQKADGSGTTTLEYDNGDDADIRRYETHIYFLAPCAIGTATNGLCQSGDDDTPTLKRLVLTDGPAFEIEPLVEGVEYLQFEYGIDSSPTAEDSTTGEPGDGVSDAYEVASTMTAAEWSQTVTVRAYMLVRSLNEATGTKDEKSYTLGKFQSFPVSATNDKYKRHVFSNEMQIINVAGRREIPL